MGPVDVNNYSVQIATLTARHDHSLSRCDKNVPGGTPSVDHPPPFWTAIRVSASGTRVHRVRTRCGPERKGAETSLGFYFFTVIVFRLVIFLVRPSAVADFCSRDLRENRGPGHRPRRRTPVGVGVQCFEAPRIRVPRDLRPVVAGPRNSPGRRGDVVVLPRTI